MPSNADGPIEHHRGPGVTRSLYAAVETTCNASRDGWPAARAQGRVQTSSLVQAHSKPQPPRGSTTAASYIKCTKPLSFSLLVFQNSWHGAWQGRAWKGKSHAPFSNLRQTRLGALCLFLQHPPIPPNKHSAYWLVLLLCWRTGIWGMENLDFRGRRTSVLLVPLLLFVWSHRHISWLWADNTHCGGCWMN